jgi:peptidoglycan hydrolase-like protein with peptidoglycan-binding domain
MTSFSRHVRYRLLWLLQALYGYVELLLQLIQTATDTLFVLRELSDVANLQTFFKDNSAIYPEGLVTGYYGGLTKNAVLRFQAEYGLAQVGRVGPMTRDKINSLIAVGGWTMTDMSGPAFYNVTRSQTSNSATFTFNTNETTNVRVVYNTSPQMFNEGDINSNGFGAIGGSVVFGNGMNTSHTVTVSGLYSNTTYYYTVIATDAAGNVSVFGPNNTFRTN